LFNRLTRSRDALVADQPGLTRDPPLRQGRVGSAPNLVVDTGGLGAGRKRRHHVRDGQTKAAGGGRSGCGAVLVDGRAGCTPQDAIIAEQLRRTGKPILLLVNKAKAWRAPR